MRLAGFCRHKVSFRTHMTIPIFQVDAFAHKPFSGNPAAVCLLKNDPTDDWLRNVAAEMNLSETAFLVKEGNGFRLRWFTPKVEVDLCGHATLASAHVLWDEGILREDQPARFWTLCGELIVRKKGNWIELDFPEEPSQSCEAPNLLLQVLPERRLYVGKNRMDYLVLLESEEMVQSFNPDLNRLATLATRGLIVTAPSTSSEFDFVSRFFAPSVGIDEDPVTGSAHCCLGPFWSGRLNKSEMTARQLSYRGGTLRLRVENQRVYILGRAVTVFRGNLEA